MTNDIFKYPVHVTWGDCDPAQIVYTGHIPGFALKAIDGWWEHHLDGDGWFQMEMDRGYGTPFVHMSFDFRSPITPRHRLICSVAPVRLGTSSIEFRVVGRQDNVVCFEGRFVCVFVIAGKLRPRPAPDDVRVMIAPLLLAADAEI